MVGIVSDDPHSVIGMNLQVMDRLLEKVRSSRMLDVVSVFSDLAIDRPKPQDVVGLFHSCHQSDIVLLLLLLRCCGGRILPRDHIASLVIQRPGRRGDLVRRQVFRFG